MEEVMADENEGKPAPTAPTTVHDSAHTIPPGAKKSAPTAPTSVADSSHTIPQKPKAEEAEE
jgi:hypothetical protein